MSQIENNAVQNEEAAQAPAEFIGGRKIVAKTGNTVAVENIFKFRKQTDKDTGVITERANVVLTLAVPSLEGIVDILENGDTRPKELELLLSAVHQVVIDRAKDFLSDDTNLTSENFPLDKLTFAAIANEPDSERGGRGLDKELLAAFGADYLEVMPAATGKDIKVLEKQVAIILQRFTPIRNHAQKDTIIKGFSTALDVYIGASKNLDDFATVVEYLQKRLEALAKTEVSMTDALGF